jgi:hypothetical protein
VTASMICRHGREASVCFPCSTTAKRPQKPNPDHGQGRRSPLRGKFMPGNIFARGFSGTSKRGGRPALTPYERRSRERDRKRRQRERIRAMNTARTKAQDTSSPLAWNDCAPEE